MPSQRARSRFPALLCATLASVFLLSAADVAKAQQPPARDIKAKVDPLIQDLAKFDSVAVPEDVRDVLKPLKTKLNELEKKAPLSDLSDRVAELKKLVDSIDPKKTTIWPGLVDDVGVLMDSLAKIEEEDPTAAARRRADRLLAATKKSPIGTYPPLLDSISKLFPAIEAIEAVKPGEAIQRRALSLTQLLTGKPATTASPTLPAALDGLAAAVGDYRATLEPPADPPYRIHIIRSWFGDLRTRWREGRLCAATATMMTKCEAQEECRLNGEGGITYDPQVLCGFDPAPLVDPAYKGVAIAFTCVRGGKQTWDAIAQHPGIDPETGAAWKETDINHATLRSSGMSFRCPFPVKAATKPQ
jgi:hypothetical protein